jgi:Chaperone of endosialidase
MDRRDLSRALLAALGASVLTSRPAQAAPQATQTATTRADLKAIDTSTTTATYLAEPGREGWFVWQTGNFTSQLAADGFEGIYIEANAVNISSGCWVRVLEEPGTYHMDWFGARGAADILPIWNKASAIAAGGTLRFGAGTYVTSGTLSYRAASNAPLNICGVSMTRTIVRNTGSGFTFEYYGGQGADNQANGGGLSDLKIERGGSLPCSGIDIANVSFGQVHHTDTSKVGGTGIRIFGRGRGDTDATNGTRIFMNRSCSNRIGIQIRGDTAGSVVAAHVVISDNDLAGNSVTGLWVACADEVHSLRNLLTSCGHTAGGKEIGRGNLFIEYFGSHVRNFRSEQNEYGNGIAGCTYDVIIDALVGGQFAHERHIRNKGEAGSGGYLLGFAQTKAVVSAVTFEHDYWIVEGGSSYRAYAAGGTSMLYSDNRVLDPQYGMFSSPAVRYDSPSIFASIHEGMMNSASKPVEFNRLGPSDAVLAFKREGVQVGSVVVSASSTAYNTTSDERLKDDLGEMSFEKALELVRRIEVHEYAWKVSGSRDSGAFAQQLHEIYPAAVTPGRGEPGDADFVPWAVDYSKLVAPIIRAVQGVDRRLQALEVRELAHRERTRVREPKSG